MNILLTGLASDQLLSSCVHCSREFLMPKHHLSSNPRKQRVPQRARHTGSILWKEPKNGDYTGDSNDSCGRSVRPFGRGLQDTRPPPTDATLPWEGGTHELHQIVLRALNSGSNNTVFDTSQASVPDLMYDCGQKHLSQFLASNSIYWHNLCFCSFFPLVLFLSPTDTYERGFPILF